MGNDRPFGSPSTAYILALRQRHAELAGRVSKIGADAFISCTNCSMGRLCTSRTDTDDAFSSIFMINTSFIYQRPRLPQIIARSDGVHVVAGRD